jgi:hypothetical protein
MNGKDITNELRGIGLSDKQIFEAIAYCEGVDFGEVPVEVAVLKCGFTAQQSEAISKRNLWGWWIQETKLWEYVFPAHKEVHVVHEYSPHAGLTWGFNTSLIDKACIDKRTAKAIEKLPATDSENSRLFVESVAYILKTGNNWKGPIAHFKLIIRKSSPDQIVSLCFRGRPKHVDGNIEFTEYNFVPEDDLVVYFFKKL